MEVTKGLRQHSVPSKAGPAPFPCFCLLGLGMKNQNRGPTRDLDKRGCREKGDQQMRLTSQTVILKAKGPKGEKGEMG